MEKGEVEHCKTAKTEKNDKKEKESIRLGEN